MKIMKQKKLFLSGLICLLTTLVVVIFVYLNCSPKKCECNEKKSTEILSSQYSVIYDDHNIEILEEKLNTSGDHSMFDIDLSSIKRGEKATIDVNNQFDCEWKGKEVDNYIVKESYCRIFEAPPINTPNDNWIYYEVLAIGKDDFTINYQIIIDDKLITEKELKTVMGTPIQSVKFIDGQFIVDFQTNLEIIPATEETKVIQPKGYYSSIWINGKDVLDDTEYVEAFSPNEINGKLTYFIEDKDKTVFNFDGKIIDLPYKNIPHYGCCEESQFNIVSKDNVVDFFGQKDGNWYHVQIKGKE